MTLLLSGRLEVWMVTQACLPWASTAFLAALLALPMCPLEVNDFLCDGSLVLVFLPQLVGSVSRLISSHSPQTGEQQQEG